METPQQYREWYEGQYGHKPGMKCVEEFCKLHDIPVPGSYEADITFELPKKTLVFGKENE